MKKALLVILTALLTFTAACSGGGSSTATTATTAATPELAPVVKPDTLIPEGFPTDDNYHEESDFPYLVTVPDEITYCAQTGEYYLLAGDFLMRRDADTQEMTPICAKEGCLHHKEQDLSKKAECDALYTDGITLRSIYYYNERLYVTHNPISGDDYVMTSIRVDGTDRREELRFPNSSMLLPGMAEKGSAGTTILHRGMFYYTWARHVGDNRYALEVWVYAPDKPDKDPQCIFRTENSCLEKYDGYLTAYGTKLYLFGSYSEPGTDYIVGASFKYLITKGEAYILDLLSGEWTAVEVPDGYDIKGQQILDGSLLISCQSFDALEQYYESLRQEAAGTSGKENPQPSNSGTFHVLGDYVRFRLTLDGRDPVRTETMPELSDTRFVSSDERYFYKNTEEEGVPDSEELCVYDMVGNLLAQRSLADLLRKEYELKGDSYDVEIDIIPRVLHSLGEDNAILETAEIGRWYDAGGLDHHFLRISYYYIDTKDAENGKVELQELFSFDEVDYEGKRISERWQ